MTRSLQRLFATTAAVLLGLAATPALSAEPDWEAGFNLRGGVTRGNLADDLRSNRMVGFGFSVSKAMGAGRIIGEAAYLVVPGEDYFHPLPAAATVATSTDRRKYNVQGFSFRGGWRAPIAASGWNWQAGLSLDRYKVRQEVSGQITMPSGTEGLSATPESAKILPGFFGGVHTRIGEDFSFEANLFSVGYSKVDYVTASSTGGAAGRTETNRRGLGLELVLGFRF